MNQPTNWLVNHLGLTNLWFSYSLYSSRFIRYSFLNIININYYLRILFKNGLIYTFHLFYHKFFFQFIQLLTLPVYITEWTFSKFYRWYKIKNIKKHYLLRKYLQFMHLSVVHFYRLNNWLLISLFIYLPHMIKWKKYDIFASWHWIKHSYLIIQYYQFFLLNYICFYLYNYL